MAIKYAYVFSVIYCIGLLWILLQGVNDHRLYETYENLTTRKVALIIVLVTLVMSPVDLMASIIDLIPEGSYEVELTVKCNDDILDGIGTIEIVNEAEVIDFDQDGSVKEKFYNNYYLSAVVCDDEKYKITWNYDEPIVDSTIEATIEYMSKGKTIEKYAIIFLPELTEKTLGISMGDKISSYSTYNFLEHCAGFFAAIFDLLLCILALSKRDCPVSDRE